MKTIVNVIQNLLKPYVDNKDTAAKQAVENNIAPVEADATSASGSYSEGDQLVLNDILYDVTASITAGDPLTAGVNISPAPKLSTAVSGKQDQIEVSSMPTASAAYLGKVLIYIGATGTYTSGQSYQCINDNGSYSWQPTGVPAANVAYDNTQSGMSADDAQEAIDELNDGLANEAATRSVMGAKNLLKNIAATKTDSDSGLTFTVNADKSITVSVTSGSYPFTTSVPSYTDINTNFALPKGNYILSGGKTNKKSVYLLIGSSYKTDTGGEISVNLTEDSTVTRARLNIVDGATFTEAETFYPMIRLSTDSNSDYHPYADDNQTLTAKVAQNATDISSVKSDLTNLEDDVEDIKKRIDICYGFEIDGSESNPSSAVTYISDAVGLTPAAMNYTTGSFNYGSWEDAFFMPRPCMLKSDGTVDYYLDSGDYTKKEDGTASDIGNTAYDGNAMMEWGRNGRKIWLKIQPSSDGHSAKVWIANNQVDSKFHDYSFHNCKGESAEHFYTPIYNGSVISSKMRSLSGQTVSKSLAGTAEITAAKANNPSTDELWNIECFADRVLINMLLILMGKSLDTQTVFGQGANSGGSEAVNDTFTTGVHNTKGLFYGTNSGEVSANTFGNCVKVFGMENYYGFQWRRTNGLILNNGATKYKLAYGTEDGSAATGYNTDGTDYKNANVTPSGTSGGYISAAKFAEDGMFSDTMSGSASTYFCDGTWFNNSTVTFALFGGVSNDGARVGAFCLALNVAVSVAPWHFGASVSCKPLA